MCPDVHSYVCLWKPQGKIWISFLRSPPHQFLRRGLLLIWNLSIRQAAWPLSLRKHVSAYPALGLQVHCAEPGFFMWSLRTELRSSCLRSKYFNQRAISPAHRGYLEGRVMQEFASEDVSFVANIFISTLWFDSFCCLGGLVFSLLFVLFHLYHWLTWKTLASKLCQSSCLNFPNVSFTAVSHHSQLEYYKVI